MEDVENVIAWVPNLGIEVDVDFVSILILEIIDALNCFLIEFFNSSASNPHISRIIRVALRAAMPMAKIIN